MSRKRILVVDDEPVARRLIMMMLGPGYDLVPVGSGHEALEILAIDRFDLLITDGQMPGMLGMDLISAVSERYPGLACLMVSGNIDEVREAWLQSRGVPYVHKPYKASDLRQAVSEALPT